MSSIRPSLGRRRAETMADGLHFLTIVEAAELIAARKLSPVELTETCLARIAALDDQLERFVTVTSDRARRDAKKTEAEIMASGARGPLHGIPYCLKDIFDVAGVRTTAQSRLLASNVPLEDSVCAAKLEAAGAILLGKNATWEFAHGGPSWDVLFPPARNPWNNEQHLVRVAGDVVAAHVPDEEPAGRQTYLEVG
jgi:aspartyl-tRNA(Asn)/glutamyl-tRNA(Gln) amidotransferase subunit A